MVKSGVRNITSRRKISSDEKLNELLDMTCFDMKSTLFTVKLIWLSYI